MMMRKHDFNAAGRVEISDLIEGRPIFYVYGENKKSEKLFVQTGFSDGLLLSFLNIMNKRAINLAARSHPYNKGRRLPIHG